MKLAEALDLAAKILTIISTALYLTGYIDAGTFLSLVTAATALISTLMMYRMGLRLHAASRRKRAGGVVKDTSQPCPVCIHPQNYMIEELLDSGVSVEAVAERFPGIGVETLTRHMGLHAKHRERNAVEELKHLLKKLKHLYARLELFTETNELKAREYIAAVNTKLDIVSKIKDLTLSIEKLKPSADGRDLSTLLQQLVEEERVKNG